MDAVLSFHEACKKDKIGEVRQILSEKNAKTFVDATNKKGNTALHLVSKRGIQRIAELLLNHMADVNVKNVRGRTPLHLAREFEMAELLINKGADVNIKDHLGKTPLYDACSRGLKSVSKLLLQAGADAVISKDDGITILHRAAESGLNKIVKMLIKKGADVNAKDQLGQTPLHFAATHKVATTLIDHGAKVDAEDYYGRTPLYEACFAGEKEVSELLLQKGAKVNALSKYKETLLHAACRSGSQAVCKLLLKHKAVVDAKNDEEQTPLWIACSLGYKKVAKLLMKNGATVNAMSDDGTPLHAAIKGKYLKVVDCLLNHHADVNLKNKDGLSCLDLAKRKGLTDIEARLLQPSATDNDEDSDDDESEDETEKRVKYKHPDEDSDDDATNDDDEKQLSSQQSWSTPDWAQAIQANYKYLVDNLDPIGDGVADYLVSEEVFTLDNLDYIQRGEPDGTRQAMCRRFLTLLNITGQGGYTEFLQVFVKSGCQHIADKLVAPETDSVPSAVQPTPQPKGGAAVHNGGHIMISYQHNFQKQILKIRDQLAKRGFKLWVDVDQMRGDIVDCMCVAVDSATAVLMCMSKSYMESENCRKEISYATQPGKRKPIVPLLMEKNYKPDKWVGFTAGHKLYFDFSGRHPFSQKIDELVRELERRGFKE